ncbi:GAD-like domain-containing protein [Methylocaldum sp. MU1018]
MARRTKAPTSETFLKVFGPGDPYRPFEDADEGRLSGRIPGVMLEILRKEGWCSYKDQVLWLCDPDDWQPAAHAWFPSEPQAQVLARTAFGDLFIWDGEMFWFVLVHESLAMTTVDDPDWFFSRMLTADDFAPQTHLPGRVRAARETAGPLRWDEMYTYVPAFALGGSESSSRIERVKALEALALLASLAPLRRA